MTAHPARAEPAFFTLYRKRTASALAACGGYVIAAFFIWAARLVGGEMPPDALEEVVFAAFGAALVLLSTGGLTMAALNTPIATFTPDGVLVGGVRLLFGHPRFVPWSKISAFDTLRVRNRTLLQIQLRQPSASGDRTRAVRLLWELARYLSSDMNFSERPMATPLPDVIAELRLRFAKELHDNHIRIRG